MCMNELMALEQGFSLYEEKKYQECIDVLLPIAENNVQAQVCLGIIYWHNLVKDEDANSLALYWYNKAGERGHGLAQLWLANNYSVGLKSEANPALAAYWYQKAAAQDITVAQYSLAICYSAGLGIGRNVEKALVLMQKAANKNFFPADLFLLEHFNLISSEAEEYRNALASFEKKYENSLFTDETSSYRYIEFLLHGTSFEKFLVINHDRAFTILRHFPIFESERGAILLGDCYARGWGTNQSQMRAREIYQLYSETNSIARSKLLLLTEE